MSEPVSSDLLREVIREVVRDVIREVVAEEIAAAGVVSAATARRESRAAAPVARTRPPSTSAAGPGRLERGALTERIVRAAGASSTISIGRAVVVTPLAKERAKAMGVTIIRIDE